MRDLIRRIDVATPAGRDRAVDALRAMAILGVVLGHWLVTALVADSGTVRVASPLRHMPQLAPVSWLLQTMAVFFLVGGQMAASGHTNARDRGQTYLRWLATRMARLFRPVTVVLAVWSAVAAALLASGADLDTVRALVKLVLSPMWFLLVFAVLTAATPLAAKLHPLWPLVTVALVDLVRYGLGGPAWLGWTNLAAGWLVPYCLGAAWARGDLRSRTTGWALLLGGAAATAALVLWAGYPAAMVGVPGAPISNQSPPTLAAVAFGLTQCGAALLLLGPLRRVLRRPAAWAVVALVNLSAMTIFLWHQTALIAVTAIGLLADGPLTGLHTVPDDPGWLLARLAWLPAFALALLVCWAAFRAYERRRPGKRGRARIGGGRRGGPGTAAVACGSALGQVAVVGGAEAEAVDPVIGEGVPSAGEGQRAGDAVVGPVRPQVEGERRPGGPGEIEDGGAARGRLLPGPGALAGDKADRHIVLLEAERDAGLDVPRPGSGEGGGDLRAPRGGRPGGAGLGGRPDGSGLDRFRAGGGGAGRAGDLG
ncbi:peptidoglycan/LPS O-acetylase OafA/YrhL [Streptosporangium album]|uniref:Peptidoglycan/LPS O-acetylase OafA/YrhL n=1 Tax=Streptosporangium album TaxID=47479 RepID=A0A7W7S556_9ACTN|nr:peptidoglycan/LPS O-acetylase OafA/YrhL [Streptosporangium album]